MAEKPENEETAPEDEDVGQWWLERREDLKDHVKSALTYPMLILILTGVSLAVLMTLVVPEFRPLFEEAGAEMPWPTLVIIAVSDFLLQFGWALLLGMLLALLALRRYLQRPEGRLDQPGQWHHADIDGRPLCHGH